MIHCGLDSRARNLGWIFQRETFTRTFRRFGIIIIIIFYYQLIFISLFTEIRLLKFEVEIVIPTTCKLFILLWQNSRIEHEFKFDSTLQLSWRLFHWRVFTKNGFDMIHPVSRRLVVKKISLEVTGLIKKRMDSCPRKTLEYWMQDSFQHENLMHPAIQEIR